MRRSMLLMASMMGVSLAGSACSATPQGSAQGVSQNTDAGAQPVPTVPQNAPVATFKNVPATTGKANLSETKPPFTIATIGRFDAPFAMAFLPDGRLLVTEKAGKLKLRATTAT